jgi:hypothetical protein
MATSGWAPDAGDTPALPLPSAPMPAAPLPSESADSPSPQAPVPSQSVLEHQPEAAHSVGHDVSQLTPEHLEAARLELDRLMAEHRAAQAAERAAQPADGLTGAPDPSLEHQPGGAALPETPWWVAVDEDEQLDELDVAPEALDPLVLVHQDAEDPVASAGDVVDLTGPDGHVATVGDWRLSLRSDGPRADATVDLRDPSPVPSEAPDDVLARLDRLRDAGLLSAEEYEHERRTLVQGG